MPDAAILPVHSFVSFTLAILLLFAGKELTRHWVTLRRYSIPEPVVGGVLIAALVAVLYLATGVQVHFELDVREMLLLYFFAGVGLKSDLATLRRGGRPVLVLSLLAGVYILLQNLVGMGVAGAMGQDPRAGLMTGSVSLVGGMGTTLAWAPDFVERLGIANALELGMASNMVGLIAACVVGGPIATFLIRRHHLRAVGLAELETDVPRDEPVAALDYYGVLRAWLWLNLALLLGHGLTGLIRQSGLNLPDFVGCLLAGMLIRNLIPLAFRRGRIWRWSKIRPGLVLISDICLGMFLTMALMGLRLWELQGDLLFLLIVLTLQILLAVVFTIAVVYRLMGRDYEAAVVASGFGGIALGSTATAVANMTAVTHQYGAAHRAFLVVPLVCGFAVDLLNALIVNLLAR